MNEYTSIYEIKDLDVIDGRKEYTVNMTTERIETPEMYKDVASAVYRITDEIFGVRYRVDLKPEYTGIIKRFDRPISENALNDRKNLYFISRLLKSQKGV